MKLAYFAWVRERIGVSEEEIEIPAGVETVGSLLGWLSERGEGYRAALENPDIIRVAIDQEHVGHDAALHGAREIAVFPPMTGG